MADSKSDVEIMEVDNEVITIYDDEEMAEAKKDEGNKFYKLKQYRQALPLYTQAIEFQPNVAAYYGNRSACYMMLGQYKEALEDARKAISIDPKYVKGYIRVAKCFIALGDLAAANSALLKVKELDPDNPAIAEDTRNLEAILKYKEDADKAYEKKDYRKVVYCMDRALDLGVTSPAFKLRKAECLVFLGRYAESQEIANDVLHFDKQNADAIYVRGLCLYYGDNADNIEHAFSHFQHGLKLAPDHKKLLEAYKKAKSLKQKKEEGNEAFKAQRLQEAYDLYTEALSIDPNNNKTNAKLYFNRATVCAKLNRLNEAVNDCTLALKLDDKYLKALLRRARCYMELEEYEEAVKDYEQACKMDKSRENKRLLSEAKLELKKSKRKDYYKILGIGKSATTDEIKKAYRKRALVHHPDRHANASDSERLEQEKKFKEVGEAYGILSDPKKRARYDSGQDLEDMDGMADFDPNRVFHAFFGDPNAGNFAFNASGFPGTGFTFQFA